ncbi:MAG: hypothetical protein ACSHX7_01700 [Luteolibacter sp.]
MEDTTVGGMAAEAFAGFLQATGIWESTISTDITINLEIRFDDSLGSSLATTVSTGQAASYSAVRNAMILRRRK